MTTCVISPDLPIEQALARLDAAGTGVLLLAGDDGKLFGVVTDGDVRRHILAGETLSDPVSAIASQTPLVASPDVSARDARILMDQGREFPIHHLPLVQADGRLVGLMLRSDLKTQASLDVFAVIMAGGFGTRLRPLTEQVPKPMLPVGDRPLLEVTLARLRNAGIRHVKVTTHYLADRITGHFGDGRAFGVDLSYLQEDRPLGTAGALRYLDRSDELVLVMNGDILTEVDFNAMVAYHREQGGVATIGVRQFEMRVPYGVVECDGTTVRALREKPTQRFLINAGIYLLEPSVLASLPNAERFDMTDVIQGLLDARRRVVSFAIIEQWIDIGQHAEYAQAQLAMAQTEGAS